MFDGISENISYVDGSVLRKPEDKDRLFRDMRKNLKSTKFEILRLSYDYA